jgi:cobalt-zinc-cadmium efflux system outer membrane protein
MLKCNSQKCERKSHLTIVSVHCIDSKIELSRFNQKSGRRSLADNLTVWRIPKMVFSFTTVCVLTLALQISAVGQQTSMNMEQTRSIPGNSYALMDFKTIGEDTLFNGYLQIALEESNALKASFESWVAAGTMGDQLGALPNPEIMFQYFLNPMKYDGVFSQATIGVMQMFPWFGVRQEGRNYASTLADARWQVVEQTRSDIIQNLKASWNALILIHMHRTHFKEHLEWVDGLERLINRRLESGYAARADLIRLEMERMEIISQINILDTEYLGEQTRFNSYLNRPFSNDVNLPSRHPEYNWSSDRTQTYENALQHNPRARELQVMQRAASIMENRARLEGYPMIGFGAEIMGTNYIMQMEEKRVPVVARVAIQLPIWRSKYRAIAGQAAAESRRATYEVQDYKRSLQSSVAMAISKYAEADQKVRLYREALLPKTRELTDLLLLDYSGGRARMDEVIDSRRKSVDYVMLLDEAIFEKNLAVVELEILTAQYKF